MKVHSHQLSTRRARFVNLALTGVLVLSVAPSANAINSTSTASVATVTVAKSRWPRNLCAKQPGHRITTTSTQDGYIAEPTNKRPTISAKRAYAKFVHIYGRQRPVERNATQIRYGVLTTNDTLLLSDSALEYEPLVRRTAGWIITNCAAPTRPRDIERHPGRPGRLVFALADQEKPLALGWSYEYKGNDGVTYATMGSGIAPKADSAMPPAGSTRYYSVPWTLVARANHSHRVLLKYKQMRCYSFDHVVLDTDVYQHHGARVAVILSTGPNGTCAKQSAIAPFMDATSDFDRLGPLHHGKLGELTFKTP